MTNPLLDQQRSSAINNLNKFKLEQLPDVDIIMASKRPSLIGRIVENINNQVVNVNKVCIVTQGYTPQQIQTLKTSIKNARKLIITEDNDPSHFAGYRNNINMQNTQSDYIAIMDDDDIYFPNYLLGQLSYLYQTDYAMVLKGNPIARDESVNKIGFIKPGFSIGDNLPGPGGTYLFKRSTYDQYGPFKNTRTGYDNTFIRTVARNGEKLSSSDSFNFILTRGRPEGNTWNDIGRTNLYLNDISFKEIMV